MTDRHVLHCALMVWKEAAPRLDVRLQEARVTSAKIARELNVDPSLVSRWRSGERVPDVEQFLHMIARAGVSSDEILGVKPAGSVASRASLARELAQLSQQVESLAERVRSSKG